MEQQIFNRNAMQFFCRDCRSRKHSIFFSSDPDYDADESNGPQTSSFNLTQPIYPGSNLNLQTSLLLILTFSLTYNLTDQAVAHLLQIINLHCLAPTNFITSVYKFKKYFKNLQGAQSLNYHKYCSFCKHHVATVNENNKVCGNSLCKRTLQKSGSISYFIEIPIEEQIKTLLSRNGFYDSLQYRFTRRNTLISNIEDVYVGNIYKDMVKRGLLDKPNNISFTWNTDGVPIFKSLIYEIWAIFLKINELPPRLRGKRDNVLLGGLWFGVGKPKTTTCWKPFHKSFGKLESEGICVTSPDTNQPFVMKCFMLFGTCDLPAKCLCQNFIQYNDFNGCAKCLQPGKTAQAGKGTSHVYLYYSNNPGGPVRTDISTKADAKQAMATKTTVSGVRGPCHLDFFLYYSIINGTRIDWMHGVLLGTVKMLMTLWFSQGNKSEPYYCGEKLPIIEKRLLGIAPSNEITRRPRTIANNLGNWKSSEFRSWLMLYSLPVLKGILPNIIITNTSSYLLKEYGDW